MTFISAHTYMNQTIALETLLNIFNHPDNNNGNYIKILISGTILLYGHNIPGVVLVILHSCWSSIARSIQGISRTLRPDALIDNEKNFVVCVDFVTYLNPDVAQKLNYLNTREQITLGEKVNMTKKNTKVRRLITEKNPLGILLQKTKRLSPLRFTEEQKKETWPRLLKEMQEFFIPTLGTTEANNENLTTSFLVQIINNRIGTLMTLVLHAIRYIMSYSYSVITLESVRLGIKRILEKQNWSAPETVSVVFEVCLQWITSKINIDLSMTELCDNFTKFWTTDLLPIYSSFEEKGNLFCVRMIQISGQRALIRIPKFNLTFISDIKSSISIKNFIEKKRSKIPVKITEDTLEGLFLSYTSEQLFNDAMLLCSGKEVPALFLKWIQGLNRFLTIEQLKKLGQDIDEDSPPETIRGFYNFSGDYWFISKRSLCKAKNLDLKRDSAKTFLEVVPIRQSLILKIRHTQKDKIKDRRRTSTGRQFLLCSKEDLLKLIKYLKITTHIKKSHITTTHLSEIIKNHFIDLELANCADIRNPFFLSFDFIAPN